MIPATDGETITRFEGTGTTRPVERAWGAFNASEALASFSLISHCCSIRNWTRPVVAAAGGPLSSRTTRALLRTNIPAADASTKTASMTIHIRLLVFELFTVEYPFP